jgi:hypothetical protein
VGRNIDELSMDKSFIVNLRKGIPRRMQFGIIIKAKLNV